MPDPAASDPVQRLADARADTLRRIRSLRAEVADIVNSASSTTGDDEHDPEGATIGFERAQAMALLAQAEKHLLDLDAAAERVADGSYGRCIVCGDRISDERLDARPEATHCISCASRLARG